MMEVRKRERKREMKEEEKKKGKKEEEDRGELTDLKSYTKQTLKIE